MSVDPLAHDQIVVEQVRKLFELRNQYGLFAIDGQRIGSIEQVGQGPLAVAVRFLGDLDVALPISLLVEDHQGQPVLRLDKAWFRWVITVTRADATVLGSIRKRWRLGKARFEVLGADGAKVADVRATNWRARDFAFADASGRAVANVTKQWRGLATEMFTDADSYVVDLQGAEEPLRSLALAAALSIDIIMKQKD